MATTPGQIDIWRQSRSEYQRLEFKEAKSQFDNRKLYAYCVAIANEGGSSFILADMLPANLAAFYSFSSGLDVGAHLDIDLKHTNDIVVGVLVRAFL